MGDKVNPNGYIKIIKEKLPQEPEEDFWFFSRKNICVVIDTEGDYKLHLHSKAFKGCIGVAHPKQCRKLVKKVKCDYCNGEGKCWIDSFGNIFSTKVNNSLEPILIAGLAVTVCIKCNGSGKVKI